MTKGIILFFVGILAQTAVSETFLCTAHCGVANSGGFNAKLVMATGATAKDGFQNLQKKCSQRLMSGFSGSVYGYSQQGQDGWALDSVPMAASADKSCISLEP